MRWTNTILQACAGLSLASGLLPASASASIVVDDTFPIGQGYHLLGFDPDASAGAFDRPGLAVEFRTSDSVKIAKIEVALNLLVGANEVDVSLHESEAYFDKVRPGGVIETFHVSGSLGGETQVIALSSLLQPTLAADSSYFVSVTTEEQIDAQIIRWALGDEADTGFVRAYMRPDRSWDTFAFTSFPRTALRVLAVPEPSTFLLLAWGLACVSLRARRHPWPAT